VSARINEQRRNNPHGVPGMRLQERKGLLCVDVTWHADKRRHGTSFPVGKSPLQAVERAAHKRMTEAGAVYPWTARQMWERLKKAKG
jgi:hypothetical protein